MIITTAKNISFQSMLSGLEDWHNNCKCIWWFVTIKYCLSKNDVRYVFTSECLYLQLFLWVFMLYLRYLYLFAYNGVQHILCCVFGVFLRLMYPILTVSLDFSVLLTPSLFSNVYYPYSGVFSWDSNFRFIILYNRKAKIKTR